MERYQPDGAPDPGTAGHRGAGDSPRFCRGRRRWFQEAGGGGPGAPTPCPVFGVVRSKYISISYWEIEILSLELGFLKIGLLDPVVSGFTQYVSCRDSRCVASTKHH